MQLPPYSTKINGIDKKEEAAVTQITMHLLLTPTENGTRVMFEIDYSHPGTPWGWIVGLLLVRKCANGCLERACEDAKKALESTTSQKPA